MSTVTESPSRLATIRSGTVLPASPGTPMSGFRSPGATPQGSSSAGRLGGAGKSNSGQVGMIAATPCIVVTLAERLFKTWMSRIWSSLKSRIVRSEGPSPTVNVFAWSTTKSSVPAGSFTTTVTVSFEEASGCP